MTRNRAAARAHERLSETTALAPIFYNCDWSPAAVVVVVDTAILSVPADVKS